MAAHPPVRTKLIAVITATAAALFLRAWIQLRLLSAGFQDDFAADLSYLVVPPVLLVLLFPLWRHNGAFITRLYRSDGLNMRVALIAIALGCLLRLAAWCELIAGVSFGWYRNIEAAAIIGPTFAFNCPTPSAVALGIVVMVVLVPIIEETINRGLIQTWLSNKGAVVAISVSALIFMLSHRPSSWGFAFAAGVVFGIQYWRTGTLWPSLVTHATINGVIQLDWRCLQGHWNPPAAEIPKWGPGIASLLGLMLAAVLIGWLLRKKTGVCEHPGNKRVTERLRPFR